MNDEVIDRYLTRRPDAKAAPAAEKEPEDDLGAFGWLRGIRDRAVMLELRLKDGSVTALALHLLDRADFDPSEGITLNFAGTKVKITGRNLNAESPQGARLFDGIVRHRIAWIQEMDEPSVMDAAKEATVIEEIKMG